MSLDLIVMDMDDTVYLERDYVKSGFQAVDRWIRERVGVDGFLEFAWSQFEQGARGDIFDRALKQMTLSDAFDIQELVERYRQHTPEIWLTEDSVNFLEGLEKRVPLALITDGPPTSQRNKVLALGLGQYLDETVITFEHDESWHKPNADSFVHLQKRFRASSHGCIYIGDNPVKDFRAPVALGWQTLRIRRPGGLHYELDSSIDQLEMLPGRSWLDERL